MRNGGRGGIQRATHVHRADAHIAQQLDDAVVVLHAARLDHAGVVHHGGSQRVGGLRGHQHRAAVGADELLVLRQCVERPLLHLHVEQLVAVEVQRDLIACRQRHRAELRGDDAFVGDLPAQQRDVASAACVDGALINNPHA